MSWLRATARADSLREPSTRTLGLIHRPLFALCKRADQVLEPLRNRISLKTGAVEAASKHFRGGVVFMVSGPLCHQERGPVPCVALGEQVKAMRGRE